MASLLAKVNEEHVSANDADSPLARSTLRETLAEQLQQQEALAERLKRVKMCARVVFQLYVLILFVGHRAESQ